MKTSPRRQSRNQLRIIGGKWRGRKLDFPSVTGLRPTGDRIRETLFNWLAPGIVGARCLDLFAGSGALGLEALSRGAEEAVLVDSDSHAVEQLRAHCVRLGADNARILQADALRWLEQGPDEAGFDLVFLDPPFQANLLQPTVAGLNDSNCLREDALIYVETDREQAFAAPGNWQWLKGKSTGQITFALYRYRQPSATTDALAPGGSPTMPG